MTWGESLQRVHARLTNKYGDISEVTVPLEFSTDDMHPIRAMLKAFEWGHVSRLEDNFVWQGNIKEGFPIFTDMVEWLAEEAAKYMITFKED